MSASLFQYALAITRSIYKDQLYDWIMKITSMVGGIPFIVGVGPFDTVARASANRMLDADAGALGSIANGSEVWVESFGGGNWTWRTDFPAATPTDNVTTCRPTAWAATLADGAFVRNLDPNELAWNQSWNVNSTALDNEGVGTLADPVKSDDEIQRRWGPGTRALITQPTTITYAQTPTNETNLDYKTITGGSLTFLGTRVVDQTVVLTNVRVQVRTPGSEAAWAITSPTLGAADVGKLAIISNSATPANIGAYARILKNEGAGVVMVSPFGTFTLTTGTSFVQVTPQVGDTVQVVSLTRLNIGAIRQWGSLAATALASPTRNCTLFDSINLYGGAAFMGMIETDDAAVYYARSVLENLNLAGRMPTNNAFHILDGGGATGVTVMAGAVAHLRQTGVTSFLGLTPVSRVVIFTDTYFENADFTVDAGSAGFSFGGAWFDRALSNRALQVLQQGGFRQSGAVPDWGTNNTGHGILVNSGGAYSYGTKPTINGTLGAGREAQIGGTDKQYGAVPYIEGTNNAALVLFA